MNAVKFVPAEPKARTLSKPEVLVIKCTQTKQCFFHRPLFKWLTRLRPMTVREAEILARRRGWTRLAYLPRSVRAQYSGAKAVRG